MDSTQIDDRYKNITSQPTTNNNGARNWDKEYFCHFCEKGFRKLPQHLKTQHKNEPHLIEILVEQDSKVKKEKLNKLRNMGNYKHNCDMLHNGEGVLIVGYRPKPTEGYVAPQDYGPCCDCLVFLIRTNLWKHHCSMQGKSLSMKLQRGNILLEPQRKSHLRNAGSRDNQWEKTLWGP